MLKGFLKLNHIKQFTPQLFTDEKSKVKAAIIIKAIFGACSSRLADISRAMSGKTERNYKLIQRFLKVINPYSFLSRLLDQKAPFVLCDPTEIPRRISFGLGRGRNEPCHPSKC